MITGIPLYDNIDDLHVLTGSALRSEDPLFHCFDMAQANDLKVNELPPHRVSFYTLALNFGTQSLDYSLNQTLFHHPANFLVCVAPGQVVHWKKEGEWQGYCTFFKSEFLNFSSKINFLQQYPFFNLQQTNLLPVNEVDFMALSAYYKHILDEGQKDSPYRRQIVASIFQTILWHVREIYEQANEITPAKSAGAVIASQFQYLVNENFLTKTTVEEYAEMLNVSSNHLSQTVKENTGVTAKSIINARRVEEAKYLLSYTCCDIAEISFHLEFSEPTHFTSFFKKETSLTPSQYRSTGGKSRP